MTEKQFCVTCAIVEELWIKVKIFLLKFTSFEKRSRLLRYSLPIILILIALLLIEFFPVGYFQIFHKHAITLLTLFSAVIISAWFGGIGPGVLATFLTAGLQYLIFFVSGGAYHFDIADTIVMMIYIIVCLIISIISEARYESEVQRDEFLRSTAHELKNPLSAIKGFAQLIADQAGKNALLKLQDYAGNIQSQSDRLLEVINDLLDVTRIEVGKFSYKKEPFDFDGLVKDTVYYQRVINKDRQIILSGQSKKVIMGDAYRIGQVVTNLLTNALKYSPQTTPVQVKIKRAKKGVVLEVKDRGVGIPAGEKSKIFSRLYRTKKAEEGETAGLGLGLYISSQIVEHHGGKLWVKSKEGHGSKFFLQLPSGNGKNHR
ncbi:MAG: HAMP domain-containing histidine kinase [Patescibacteria group bacterium]|nr:HAMP domain-containing histidine kinase [Patescibacteria group bacterium]